MKSSNSVFLVTITVSLLTASLAHGQNRWWTGAGTNLDSWDDPGNWTGPLTPTTQVLFGNAANTRPKMPALTFLDGDPTYWQVYSVKADQDSVVAPGNSTTGIITLDIRLQGIRGSRIRNSTGHTVTYETGIDFINPTGTRTTRNATLWAEDSPLVFENDIRFHGLIGSPVAAVDIKGSPSGNGRDTVTLKGNAYAVDSNEVPVANQVSWFLDGTSSNNPVTVIVDNDYGTGIDARYVQAFANTNLTVQNSMNTVGVDAQYVQGSGGNTINVYNEDGTGILGDVRVLKNGTVDITNPVDIGISGNLDVGAYQDVISPTHYPTFGWYLGGDSHVRITNAAGSGVTGNVILGFNSSLFLNNVDGAFANFANSTQIKKVLSTVQFKDSGTNVSGQGTIGGVETYGTHFSPNGVADSISKIIVTGDTYFDKGRLIIDIEGDQNSDKLVLLSSSSNTFDHVGLEVRARSELSGSDSVTIVEKSTPQVPQRFGPQSIFYESSEDPYRTSAPVITRRLEERSVVTVEPVGWTPSSSGVYSACISYSDYTNRGTNIVLVKFGYRPAGTTHCPLRGWGI